MNNLDLTIAIGIGDNLIVKMFLDPVKFMYDRITISHSKRVIDIYRNGDPIYSKFIYDIGKMIFTGDPYVFLPPRNRENDNLEKLIPALNNAPSKSDLDKVFCKGTSLNLDEEYIVITTKVRIFPRIVFNNISNDFFSIIRDLSKKYKIVVLGERKMEVSKEYAPYLSQIFCIYDDIIKNVTKDRILDLTVPALGITVPNIQQIQQDCLIMKEAKRVVTFGVGGNLWMGAAASDSIIGFRSDNESAISDTLASSPAFQSVLLTKDWNKFSSELRHTK